MSGDLPTGVYLDHNATTPVAPAVVAAMVEAMRQTWANPSSVHGPGQAARQALIDARAQVAGFLGCQASELVFTSGATEANHMAVLGALAARREAGRTRLVVSAVEHPGLLALAQRLRRDGTPVDLIPVDTRGRIDLDKAQDLIRDDVALVCAMGANNETGVVMPTAEIAAICRDRGAWLHVDATQLVAKSALDFRSSGADLMSVSAHKFGGPKGVGALLVKKGLDLPPLLSGRQERHRRGGTENLPGIVGFAAACAQRASSLGEDVARMRTLRDRLQQGLIALLPGIHIHGRDAERLPNTLSLRVAELDAERVLNALEAAGVVASSGAACSAGGTQPSQVLLAMGQTVAQARAGIRFSLGFETTAAEIDRCIAAAARVLAPLLAQAGEPESATA